MKYILIILMLLFSSATYSAEETKLIAEETKKNMNSSLTTAHSLTSDLLTETEEIIKKTNAKNNLKNKDKIKSDIRKIFYNKIRNTHKNRALNDENSPHILDIYILEEKNNAVNIIVHSSAIKLIQEINKQTNNNPLISNMEINAIIDKISKKSGSYENEKDISHRPYIRKKEYFFWLKGTTSEKDGIYISFHYKENKNYILAIKFDTSIITKEIEKNSYFKDSREMFIVTNKCFIIYHTQKPFIYRFLTKQRKNDIEETKKNYPKAYTGKPSLDNEKLCGEVKSFHEGRQKKTIEHSIKKENKLSKVYNLEKIPSLFFIISTDDKEKNIIDIIYEKSVSIKAMLLIILSILILILTIQIKPSIAPIIRKIIEKAYSILSKEKK